jgi:hypothetical protein
MLVLYSDSLFILKYPFMWLLLCFHLIKLSFALFVYWTLKINVLCTNEFRFSKKVFILKCVQSYEGVCLWEIFVLHALLLCCWYSILFKISSNYTSSWYANLLSYKIFVLMIITCLMTMMMMTVGQNSFPPSKLVSTLMGRVLFRSLELFLFAHSCVSSTVQSRLSPLHLS